MAMSQHVIGEVLVVSLPLVATGTVFALTAAGVYLSIKYKNNKLVHGLLILDHLVIDVVKELNQTVVEDLKHANADGKLTSDEAEQIKNKAIDLVMKRMGSGMISVLGSAFGSVFDLVSTKVEATIFDLKNGLMK
jgi:hypothetical protein